MMAARDLVAALGGRWHGARGAARCPAHRDRTPSLSIAEREGKTLLHCFGGCAQRDVIDALRRRGLWAAPEAAPVPHENRNRREALAIWTRALPDAGLVADYLRGRGIIVPVPPVIRFAPRLMHRPSGQMLPCMVAAVNDASGRIVAVHRTWLRPDGRGKADVTPAKMALGASAGGAVRLARASDHVWLVEGIEDGLALVQMTGEPAWAVLGVAGFVNVDLPSAVRTVILAPDGDEAGAAVIDRAARRLTDGGRLVRVARPPQGCDWCDMLGDFEERAAVIEFDGGEPRAVAQAIALRVAMEGR